MRYGLLQLNTTVGAFDAHRAALVAAVRKAAAQGAELCITAAMALTGSPARALLGHQGFLDAVARAEQQLAQELIGLPPLILGSVGRGDAPLPLHQAIVIQDGAIRARYSARRLARYDGYNEADWCSPGAEPGVLTIGRHQYAVLVGADAADSALPLGNTEHAEAIIHLASSPFYCGCHADRLSSLAALARSHARPLLSVNQIGGNDGVVFDGRSLHLAADGAVLHQGQAFAEEVMVVDATARAQPAAGPTHRAREAEIWEALVLGTRDYAKKTGMKRAVLGLSGGVDSALTAAVACEALGPAQVTGLRMPSPWSSAHSLTDAHALAHTLGMPVFTVPITPAMQTCTHMLAPLCDGHDAGTAAENLQARIRGVLLMGYANTFDALLLNTGNKSEASVGYCTLYGDTCGGLGVLGDVYKTDVYRICAWLNNTHGPRIPESILHKAPSAELRADQTDQDTLPPYDQLDAIIQDILEARLPHDTIVAQGHASDTVTRVAELIRRSTFKRHQLAPSIKVSLHGLGAASYPIAGMHAL